MCSRQLWGRHSPPSLPTTSSTRSARSPRRPGSGQGWAPREMRHTFVSALSANGVSAENIALLAGHDRTSTTELVYRHELRSALTQGAEVMDKIFGYRSRGLMPVQGQPLLPGRAALRELTRAEPTRLAGGLRHQWDRALRYFSASGSWHALAWRCAAHATAVGAGPVRRPIRRGASRSGRRREARLCCQRGWR